MLKIDKTTKQVSAIMEPMESLTFKDDVPKPDVVSDADFKSIPFLPVTNDGYDMQDHSSAGSFLLMDANENLHISTPEMFCKKLHCSDNDKIKVVSIFGNTGDGKSHTMNHTFFDGEPFFKTSSEQNSCTLGVYAAMQQPMGVLCLDTEGLLGTTVKRGRRMCMLLKILAISDIVIYRTRSERLHRDMYDFLGTASKAFSKYFDQALQAIAIPGTAKMKGPAVIIFHETRHTKPLESSVEKSAEDKLRESFSSLNLETNAFSSLRYVGIKTDSNRATDYSTIIAAIRAELENTTVRSPRQPSVIFKALKALNLKFSGKVEEQSNNLFPEQYFTCPVICESCNKRCQRSMGHVLDGENHLNRDPCIHKHQFENKVYLCKTCQNHGQQVIVTIRAQAQSDSFWSGVAKYAWKGSVIECQNCGEIYRSRSNWYGNKSPEATAVTYQIVHVWKGGDICAKGPTHSAQMVLDSVTYISDAFTTISAPPTKYLSDWLADKVAPSYWKPNNEITKCHVCARNFDVTGLRKHHCRGCGEGVCHACSTHEMPVPARGWHKSVRVCNDCREELLKKQDSVPENSTEAFTHTNSNHINHIAGPEPNDEADILARKYGETIYNTISSVATVALEFPKEIIKDTARPSYWVPDADAPNCYLCQMPFGTADELIVAKEQGQLEPKMSNTNTNNSSNNNSDHNAVAAASSSSTPQRSAKSLKGDCRRHHCRRCGEAVCEECARRREPVPERGWTTDVRVCDNCASVDTRAALLDAKSKAD